LESHLDDEQIDQIVGFASDWEDQPALNQTDDKARAHLENCEICQSRVAAEKTMMEWLSKLKLRSPVPSGPNCPPGDIWIEMAAGGMGEEFSGYSDHAAQCDHCGPLLRQAIADALTPDEEVQIASLHTSTAEWQRSIVERLVRLNPEQPVEQANLDPKGVMPSVPLQTRWKRLLFSQSGFARIIPSSNRLAIPAFLIGLVLLGAWIVTRWEKRQLATQLIADAYTEQRTLDVRIEGTHYVPLQQNRGAGEQQERMNRPALLKAEATIAQRLRSRPEDVTWLQASGRASLLDGESQTAVSTLEQAHLLAPNDQSVSIDLASAFIERGENSNQQNDYKSAVHILTDIVRSPTGDGTAQFNYAIALEGLGQKAQAAEAWKAFLQLYPKSPWASEAEQHLNRLGQTTH